MRDVQRPLDIQAMPLARRGSIFMYVYKDDDFLKRLGA